MFYLSDSDADFSELLPWNSYGALSSVDDSDEWEVELMDDDKLVVAYDAETEAEAFLYRTMLEEAKIDVIERPMEDSWFEGVKQQGLHSQLLVREQDAERALNLVEAFSREAESGELSEDASNPAA